MNRQEFKDKYHAEFIAEGFSEVDPETDPLTFYQKSLISKEVIEENDLEGDTIPTLFFGTSGINTGYGIFTGSCTVWLNVETPKEAVEFANKISAFEPIF
ncbi:hypothetical protein U9K52_09635 [Chryseobacterium sp. MHB01]|uniref:hypothetical protein n=1 Tax=Chryseobacterium sp. MHB01 TaxID=3109433 RepID=UPI002AFF77CB|nr:hypothetical protein [Chryseobacterium sp. MHB01]MEA1849172.1 hypothetical protein [Chryseobacterium sp. MHB01]